MQVALLLDGIGSEHFEELRKGGFRQAFDIVVASKDRPITLTKYALELKGLGSVLARLVSLRCGSLTAGKILTPLSILHLHELLSLLLVHDDFVLVWIRFAFLSLLRWMVGLVIIFFRRWHLDLVLNLLPSNPP